MLSRDVEWAASASIRVRRSTLLAISPSTTLTNLSIEFSASCIDSLWLLEGGNLLWIAQYVPLQNLQHQSQRRLVPLHPLSKLIYIRLIDEPSNPFKLPRLVIKALEHHNFQI
jgi:hypothetical protein